MRTLPVLTVSTVLLSALVLAQPGPVTKQRLNRVIELLEQKKAVFGLYAPSNRRAGPRGAAGPAPAPAPKSPLELAKEALAYTASDFVFDGSMEGDFDRAYPAFSEFAAAMMQAGPVSFSPFPHLIHPLIVKAPKMASDPVKVAEQIGRQLNLGVSGIMLVSVESADEARQGLAAMRFTSKGGTRAEDVGTAPAYWGMSEQEYRHRADLWPLNPDGELLNWTIIESKAGLARAREIAAVKGIGVLWPGAGTLRGVFSTTTASGERVLDEKAWEAAIQQVLATCKEFDVPCGYPASPNDIEVRMKQGFSVFVMNWGEAGFRAIDSGRKAAGRTRPSQ